jgi:hypothetical protein
MAETKTERKYGKDKHRKEIWQKQKQRGNIAEIEREYKEDMRLGHKPT